MTAFVPTSESLEPPEVMTPLEGQSDDPLDAELTDEPAEVAAEAVDEPIAAEAVAEQPSVWPKSWPMIVWYAFCWTVEWLFGLASVIGFLAVFAAVPVLNFISLGYLLEASGRVAKSGRLRDGFIDMPKFARIGSIVAGTWLWLLLPRLISSYATDAWLIDPGSAAARGWRIGLIVVTVIVVGHILLAWYSGGRLRHFFWPLLAPFQLGSKLVFGAVVGPIVRPLVQWLWPAFAEDLYKQRPLTEWFPPAMLAAGLWRGRMYNEARDAVWEFVASLRLQHYFWLGLRGFAGAIAWLIVPSLMLMAGTAGPPVLILVGYLGAIGLAFVLLYLPFLQTHFACQNRFAAMFEWGEVRRQFRRAPIAWWLALAVTLLFALPLYLFKIEPLPRELWWTTTIFFILFIYPARLLTGWAVGRALKREKPRFFLFRWMSRLAAIPVILFYLFVLFFTQYTSFLGPASILEQHAFLVPVPFLAL